MYVENIFALEIADDLLIRFFDTEPRVRRNFFSELTTQGDRTDERLDTGICEYPVVILAEGRRLMDEPRTTFGSDVIIHDDNKSTTFSFMCEKRE